MTPYFRQLARLAKAKGGLFNAHLHIDRVFTYSETLALIGAGEASGSSISLSAKHQIIPTIHQSTLYDEASLEARVAAALDEMITVGTTRADTVVDVTNDRVGLSALNCLKKIKDRYSSKIDFRLGAYSPFGFSDADPEPWALFEQAVAQADFVGALPERDDHELYPDHIGYRESCRRTLQLAAAHRLPIHIHVDQQNHDREDGSETVIELIKEMNLPIHEGDEPWVWLVHVISPSTYSEDRFNNLVMGLKQCNVGVICCPSAALSMRQLRPLSSPTANSLARVLEFLAAGIWVRLGSDNVCDITSPAGTLSLLDEVFVLCNALRYYDLPTLASLAAGTPLDEASRLRLTEHLKADAAEIEKAVIQYSNRKRGKQTGS